ncbi:MAG: hypothetical protein VW313_08395 [Gammaproteobacteria bacterium]
MFGSENLDVLVRTVSATPKEYISGLKQAVPDGVVVNGNEITVESGAVSIHIAIEILPDYVIALMRLPSLQATWTFQSGSHEERAECLNRIDWSMKRGGG